MKKDYTKNCAFTLAEVFVVILVISIISLAGMGVQKTKTNYTNKFMSYSAFYNLQQGIKELINTGCNNPIDTTSAPDGIIICTSTTSVLPQYGYVSKNGNTKRGLCPRLSEIFNITDAPSCTQTVPGGTTNFSSYTPNFTATNGINFYNFGVNTVQTVYTVYLDIDGNNRSGKLNEDVIKIEISTAGDVLLDVASRAAADSDYITASVQYYDSTNNKYVQVINGVNYRNAVCTANQVPATITTSASYCGAGVNAYDASSYSVNSNCSSNTCEVTLDKPHFLIF